MVRGLSGGGGSSIDASESSRDVVHRSGRVDGAADAAVLERSAEAAADAGCVAARLRLPAARAAGARGAHGCALCCKDSPSPPPAPLALSAAPYLHVMWLGIGGFMGNQVRVWDARGRARLDDNLAKLGRAPNTTFRPVGKA